MESIDLTTLGQDDLAAWLFDRVISDDPDEAGWYTNYSFETNRRPLLLTMLTSLISNWRVHAARFSRRQIDEGMWAICGPASIDVGSYLADFEIPLVTRIAFVNSIYYPYADVAAFLTPPFGETCYEMCWDLLCKAFWSEVHRPSFIPPTSRQEAEDFIKKCVSEMSKMSGAMQKIARQWPSECTHAALAARAAHAAKDFVAILTPDQRSVHDAMFSTLCRILAIDNPSCQHAALHGLGHLHHPKVAAEVQNYIDSHATQWPAEELEWLETCRDGTPM